MFSRTGWTNYERLMRRGVLIFFVPVLVFYRCRLGIREALHPEDHTNLSSDYMVMQVVFPEQTRTNPSHATAKNSRSNRPCLINSTLFRSRVDRAGVILRVIFRRVVCCIDGGSGILVWPLGAPFFLALQVLANSEGAE